MLITEYPEKQVSSDDDLFLISSQGKVNTIRYKIFMKKAQDQIDEVKLTIDDLKNKNTDISLKLTQLQEEIDNLGELTSDLEDVQQSITNLSTRVENLENSLQTQGDSLLQLAEAITTIQTSITILSTKVNSLQSVVDELSGSGGGGNVDSASVSLGDDFTKQIDLLTDTSAAYLSTARTTFDNVEKSFNYLQLVFMISLQNSSGTELDKYVSVPVLIPLTHTYISSESPVETTAFPVNFKVEFFPHVWVLLHVEASELENSNLFKISILDKDLTQLVTSGTGTVVSKAMFLINDAFTRVIKM